MDKIHKLVVFFTIARIFGLTIAETVHFKNNADKARDLMTYQLKVPGSDPITILEDTGPPYKNPDLNGVNSPYSDYSSVRPSPDLKKPVIFTKRVSNGPTYHSDAETEMYSMKPFSFSVLPPSEHDNVDRNSGGKKNTLLEKFLQNYQNGGSMTGMDDENEAVDMEGAINVESLPDGQGRKNYRPNNKNNGWVSLDAVPTYSAGKVYRWHSNAQKYRPVKPSYSQNHWNDDDDDDRYHQNRPHRPSYGYEDNFPGDFDDDEGYQVPPKPFGSVYPGGGNNRPYEKPYSSHHRPSGYSANKPFYGGSNHDDDSYPSYSYSHKRPQNDIITDNRPSNFPQYDTHRYGSSSGSYTSDKNRKPETYPGNGEGQWVLVSTTKGHQYNNRNAGKRSMKFGKSGGSSSEQTGSSISTVLHVLPNPNSRNLTTSNGEVIEVAESGRGHGSKPINPFAEPTTRRPQSVQGTKRNRNRIQVVGTAQKSAETSAPAVLAAVGAGLLPASLAIVAPMVLGRRRRDTNLDEKYTNVTTDLVESNFY
uniref:CSON011913 protein n=1 Tax=Culicoides sonorensis TaxID=179676 RepID=A0A336MG72_CULSO